MIVDALSDNKNRTAGEVRATFKKHGGALGAPGSVAWGWSRVAELRPTAPEGGFDEEARDRLFEAAVEAGADDVVEDCVEINQCVGCTTTLLSVVASMAWRMTRRFSTNAP